MSRNPKKLPIYKFFNNSKKYSIKWNSYFQVYEKIFSSYRNKKIKFVEVGVANGGSLFMWRKYFGKKAKIIGIDLNPNAKNLEKYGFKIYIGSQSDKSFWDKFFKKEGKIDLILDDGGHKNLQQISTVHYSLTNINAEIKRIISGNKDAKITIIAYESLTCSHCADFHLDIYPKVFLR